MHQWVTTRSGDRVDATHVVWVQRRFAAMATYDMPDRHLLEFRVRWDDTPELVAVFLEESDCERALDVFVRLGWVLTLPEAHVHAGRAVNPAHIMGCRIVSFDAEGRIWQAVIDFGGDLVALPFAAGMTRPAALQRVRQLTEQLELTRPPSWVDPDFTRPAWRGLTED